MAFNVSPFLISGILVMFNSPELKNKSFWNLPVVVFNATIVTGVTVAFPTFVSVETLGKVSFVCN